MKPIAIILPILLLLTGCAFENTWVLRHEPLTDTERSNVSRTVEIMLQHQPSNLSGHDQDLDAAITAATAAACKIHCRATLWEWSCSMSSYTGRYRFATNTHATTEKIVTNYLTLVVFTNRSEDYHFDPATIAPLVQPLDTTTRLVFTNGQFILDPSLGLHPQ